MPRARTTSQNQCIADALRVLAAHPNRTVFRLDSSRAPLHRACVHPCISTYPWRRVIARAPAGNRNFAYHPCSWCGYAVMVVVSGRPRYFPPSLQRVHNRTTDYTPPARPGARCTRCWSTTCVHRKL